MSTTSPGTNGRRPPPNALFEEEALGKVYDTRLLGRLWPFVRPYGSQVVLTILLVLPLLVFELLPAWIVKSGLDEVIIPAVSGPPAASQPLARPVWLPQAVWPLLESGLEGLRALLRGPEAVSPLVWLASLYFLVSLAGAVVRLVDQWIMQRTGYSAMRDLRRVVFAHIQQLHIGFFDTMPVGRLVTRATNDVENVAEMFSAGVVAAVRDLIRMAALAAVLFAVDARLAAYTFLVVPLMGVMLWVFRWKVREAYRAMRMRIARINAYLQENVTGMRVVQLFSHEERSYRDFDGMNADHRNACLQSIRYDSALFSSVELASNLTIAIVLWQSSGFAAAGTIFLFLDYMKRFFEPLRDLSAKYAVMQSSMASCERIFQLLDTVPEVRDRPGVRLPQPTRAGLGCVEFDGVWFAYGGDDAQAEPDWVLRDVSLRVEPGQRVAFVGATGAGKTTVIKLLTRLYDPSRGRVLLDGVDLRDWPQAALRQRIAMVLQDVFLFSGSIADNISLERPGVDAAAVRRVASATQAAAFIESLPQGYETVVRERGVNLSLGQRQLLSFARALAHGADVLVLDEATSSIDTETEALVQRGIHALLEDRTALVIAHRLSTIQDVDRIYVLERGSIVEAGSHTELLARGGAYERLYRLQYAEQAAPSVAVAG